MPLRDRNQLDGDVPRHQPKRSLASSLCIPHSYCVGVRVPEIFKQSRASPWTQGACHRLLICNKIALLLSKGQEPSTSCIDNTYDMRQTYRGESVV
jgi:hypothetical protein